MKTKRASLSSSCYNFFLLKFLNFSYEKGVVKINKAMKVKMCIDLLALLGYAKRLCDKKKVVLEIVFKHLLTLPKRLGK